MAGVRRLPTEPVYITLVEALALPGFKITEISDGGSVPNLRVVNETPHHVLLFDGEELKGAKQNRILNTTILIAAGTALDVPVSCTEQGRWSYASAELGSSGSLAYAQLRKSKSVSVAMNLQAHAIHLPPAPYPFPPARQTRQPQRGEIILAWDRWVPYHADLVTRFRDGRW